MSIVKRNSSPKMKYSCDQHFYAGMELDLQNPHHTILVEGIEMTLWSGVEDSGLTAEMQYVKVTKFVEHNFTLCHY